MWTCYTLFNLSATTIWNSKKFLHWVMKIGIKWLPELKDILGNQIRTYNWCKFMETHGDLWDREKSKFSFRKVISIGLC